MQFLGKRNNPVRKGEEKKKIHKKKEFSGLPEKNAPQVFVGNQGMERLVFGGGKASTQDTKCNFHSQTVLE